MSVPLSCKTIELVDEVKLVNEVRYEAYQISITQHASKSKDLSLTYRLVQSRYEKTKNKKNLIPLRYLAQEGYFFSPVSARFVES